MFSGIAAASLKRLYSAVTNVVANLWYLAVIEVYRTRVDDDYGTIEDITALEADLASGTEQENYDAIAIYNPNGGYRTKRIYDLKGNYDLTVTGGGGTRINKNGEVENLNINLLSNSENNWTSVGISKTQGTSSLTAGIENLFNSTSSSGYYTLQDITLPLGLGWLNYSFLLKAGTTSYGQISVGHLTGTQHRVLMAFDLISNTVVDSMFAGNLPYKNVSLTSSVNGYHLLSVDIQTVTTNPIYAIFKPTTSTETYASGLSMYVYNPQLTIGEGYRGLTDNSIAAFPKIDYSTGEPAFLIEPTRTNRLLNSATLATQSYTTTAVPFSLSFYGTGSITLSGSHSATLTGTGVNQRVTLTFTPTAASLTLTVSGTVTKGQLEEGSTASSYIPTNGAAVTRTESTASISVPSGVTSIEEKVNGIVNTITTIPATYQMPQGAVEYVKFL